MKVPFGIGHPHLHIKPSLYVCRRVQGSQIFKQNWIILICSRVIVILPIWIYAALGGGAGGWSTIVYMSSGMFRGKESSNRIEVSWLVQELSNFGVFGFLRLLGVGGGWMGWGWLGGTPTHVHMHAHARMCTHAHACMVNMVISCKWLPPLDLGKSWGFPMMSYARACACACVHACACACGWGAPSHHPPPPRGGDPRNHSKFNSTWTNRVFRFCLKIWNLWRLPHPWVGGWVGWWVGSGQITKNLKIADWIKIIQFCLKIYDL